MSFEVAAALVGITLILARGTIFAPMRKLWPELFECSQCVGAWVGFAAGVSGVASMGHGFVIDTILCGGLVSVSAMSIDALLMNLLDDDPHV